MKLKLFAIVLGTISGLASAAQADTERVRGTVVALAGTALTVKARDGKTDTVTLSPDWMISGVAKASATDIKQGDFLGITLSQKGLRGPAETALRKAIQIDPNYGNAHNNLAIVYISEQPPLVELAR